MTLIKTLLLVVLPLSSLTAATPVNFYDVDARDLFQVNPSLDKRTLFNVENIESDERKKYLKDAQKEAVDIAGVALKHFDDPKYASYLTAWFGPDRPGWPMGEVEDDVRGVLTNFVGENINGEGSVVLSGVKVWQDDYLRQGQPVQYCDQVNKDGKSPTAYYSRTRKGGLGPSMHFCEKFFNRKSKADYLADNCKSIANHIDTATTTRQYRGANVLHEFMHYGKVSEGQ
jgi:hypothetical protein